jgi:hypothetical protein
MDKDLFLRKITALSDDNLKDLLQLTWEHPSEVKKLAEAEALKRGIDLQTIPNVERTTNTGRFSQEESGINWKLLLAEFLHDL